MDMLKRFPQATRRQVFGTAARLRRLARSKNGRALGAAAATLVVLTLLRAYDPWIVNELKERTFDAYQRLQPRPYAEMPVRIVDIDEASIAKYGQWAWPRTRLAALTHRLGELGAGVVAFDAIFSEPDRTTPSLLSAELRDSDLPDRDTTMKLLASLPDHDRLFAEAIEKTPVVLGLAGSGAANDKRPPVKAGLRLSGGQLSGVLPPHA